MHDYDALNSPLDVPHPAPHWGVRPPQPKTAPSLSPPPPLETPLWEDTPEPPITVKKAAPFLALTLVLAVFGSVGLLMWIFSSPSASPSERDKQIAKAATFSPRQEKIAGRTTSKSKREVATLPTRPPMPPPLLPKQEEVSEEAPPKQKTTPLPTTEQEQTPEPREQTSPAPQAEPSVAAQQTKRRAKTTSPQIPTSSATDDPSETKDKPPIESEDLRPGRYRGTLVSTPNRRDSFRVAVDYRRIRVKPGKQAEYDRIQRDMTRLFGTATGEQVRALVHVELTPLTYQVVPQTHSLPQVKAKVPYWMDRLTISRAAGRSAGARAEFEELKARLAGLLEAVPDTQAVTFHNARKVQVRVLRPLAGSVPGDGEEETKPGQRMLPGRAGEVTDLKVGQRILLELKTSTSIYKRLVTLVIVEEASEDDSPSK